MKIQIWPIIFENSAGLNLNLLETKFIGVANTLFYQLLYAVDNMIGGDNIFLEVGVDNDRQLQNNAVMSAKPRSHHLGNYILHIGAVIVVLG